MSSRLLLLLLLLSLTTSVLAATTLHFNFANWSRSRWLMVREKAFPQIGEFVQTKEYIENQIPAGASEKDIAACKVGTALMLLNDWSAADFVARADLAFEGAGAPGLLLRAQHQGQLAGPMYSLILYKDGVNLWRYDGEKYHKAGAARFAVEPGKFHSVQVHARGTNFVIHVDGERVLTVNEADSLPAGQIGIWFGEGVCRVKRLSVRDL